MLTKLNRWTRSTQIIAYNTLWRLHNNYAPDAKPVFIVGVQRSGTTMLGECLEMNPEIMHYPEHDGRAFHDFILRDDDTIRSLVRRCPHKQVVFKPLTDSHRVHDLITRFGDGKAIWMYRRYENRATSAVTKFGAHNLELMQQFALRNNLSCWQAQGLGDEEFELIASLDPGTMTPQAAAVLFWYLRNLLFFKQHLESEKNVSLVSYESFVNNPEAVMEGLCHFLGINYSPRMVDDVHQGSLKPRPVSGVEDRLLLLCNEMYERMEDVRFSKGVI